ncbi:MAG: RidA family protein, partial [Candidatus Omnitrophica bacterium]|nr:RidA family protein [Candidatus Omnitrophota bacterium]
MNYEEKIKSLGLVLPAVAKPVGSYAPVIMQGDIAVLSGQISKTADGKILTGKVGPGGMSIDQAKAAARVAAINVLAIMKDMIGFQKFGRFLRVVGYVQTTPDFYDISAVVNGASDLFLEIF